MSEASVSRGPARACAHVGVELLIDGMIVSSGEARAYYTLWGMLSRPHRAVVGLVAESDEVAWSSWLRTFTRELDPVEYRDPHYVAARLHTHVLPARPRLRMTVGDIEPAAAALSEVVEVLSSEISNLLTDLATT